MSWGWSREAHWKLQITITFLLFCGGIAIACCGWVWLQRARKRRAGVSSAYGSVEEAGALTSSGAGWGYDQRPEASEEHLGYNDRELLARFYLRSTPFYQLQTTLPAIGARRYKEYVLVKNNKSQTVLMSFTAMKGEMGRRLTASGESGAQDRAALRQFLCEVDHPCIVPTGDVDFANDSGHMAVYRPFYPRGSVRDMIKLGSDPRTPLAEKEKVEDHPLSERRLAMFGRCILEGMRYLHGRGVFFCNVHVGNVMVADSSFTKCMLTDYELALVGHRSPLYNFLSPKFDRVDVDALCFGHTFYHMATGVELDGPDPIFYPKTLSPPIISILKMIFEPPAAEDSSTVESLLAHPFFAQVEMDSAPKPQKPTKVMRSLLRTALSKHSSKFQGNIAKRGKSSKSAAAQADEPAIHDLDLPEKVFPAVLIDVEDPPTTTQGPPSEGAPSSAATGAAAPSPVDITPVLAQAKPLPVEEPVLTEFAPPPTMRPKKSNPIRTRSMEIAAEFTARLAKMEENDSDAAKCPPVVEEPVDDESQLMIPAAIAKKRVTIREDA